MRELITQRQQFNAVFLEEGFAAGGNAYLTKPVDFQNISETIKKLISAR